MKKYYDLNDKLLRELCVIPAPSGLEDKRVEYITNILHSWGFKAETDDAKNVIVKIDGNSPETVVFEAHTDVVFPDTEALPLLEDDSNIYCPGCGDDTVCLASLIANLKYISDLGKKPVKTLLIVFNSCEEGLGNLKGTRAVFERYGKDISEFYTFDGVYSEIVTQSVGSHRYKVTVKSEGGHSYGNFGNQSAVDVLAKGITKIYELEVPTNAKTTYNVGVISGGTSVNTIPEEAQMLCEYRSEAFENLEYMKKKFEEIFEYMKSLGACVTVELVGDRPCMQNVDKKKIDDMAAFCMEVQKKHSGEDVVIRSASTDANIPLSMGVPAVCVGTYNGGRAHTREEWLEKSSVSKSFEIEKDIIMKYFA